MTKVIWEQPSFNFKTGSLKAKVMWILSWLKLTKSSMDYSVRRSHEKEKPGTNYRCGAEKVGLDQTEMWSYSLTTALNDTEIVLMDFFS